MSHNHYRKYAPKLKTPLLVETRIDPGSISKSYILLLSLSTLAGSEAYTIFRATVTETVDHTTNPIQNKYTYNS
ncbi:MAG: hypothetical protein ACP5N2_06735 [Candidatus Nanoarchaeia archaeon]